MIAASLRLQTSSDFDKVSVSTFFKTNTIFSKGLFRKHVYKIFANAFQVCRMNLKIKRSWVRLSKERFVEIQINFGYMED